MDIKEVVSTLIEKVKSDKNLQEKLMNNPVKTIEELTGINLPDEQVKQVVDLVKAKLSVDTISSGIDAIKNLF